MPKKLQIVIASQCRLPKLGSIGRASARVALRTNFKASTELRNDFRRMKLPVYKVSNPKESDEPRSNMRGSTLTLVYCIVVYLLATKSPGRPNLSQLPPQISRTNLSTRVLSPPVANSIASSNELQPVSRQHRPRNVPPPKLNQDIHLMVYNYSTANFR